MGYEASLYNTTSFDDATMKMTITRTQLGSPIQFNENWDFKQLRQPEEMRRFKASYADSDMKIMLSKEATINDVMSEHDSEEEEVEETQ